MGQLLFLSYSAGLDTGAWLILNPNEPAPTGNVYNTFEDVVAAANSPSITDPVVNVYVTAYTNATVAGNYDVSKIHWYGPGGGVVIEFVDAVKLIGNRLVSHNVQFQGDPINIGTATWVLTGPTFVELTGKAQITQGRNVFFDLNANTLNAYVDDQSEWADASAGTGGGSFYLTLEGAARYSSVSAQATDGIFVYDNSSNPTVTEALLDAAFRVGGVPITFYPRSGYRIGPTPAVYHELGANVNDYNSPLLHWASHISATSTDNFNITGFESKLGVWDNALAGQQFTFLNEGNNTITLKHQDVGSVAENRIIGPAAADVVLSPGDAAQLIYDSTALRWRAYEL